MIFEPSGSTKVSGMNDLFVNGKYVAADDALFAAVSLG